MYNFHISNVLELQSDWVQYHNTKQDTFCYVRHHKRTLQILELIIRISQLSTLFSNLSIDIVPVRV